MWLILFILCSLGLTNAIVYEKVFQKVRTFFEDKFKYSLINQIIHCPTCCGFYVGMFIFLIFPNIILLTNYLIINLFLSGLISSICNKILHIILFKF